MSLFPHRIELVKGTLSPRGAVRVKHGANADYVLDSSGREWVRKKEEETGFNGLLAEAFGGLMAHELGVPCPDFAVHESAQGSSWLSGLLRDVTHWDVAKLPFVGNFEELGPMLTLDAILINEDRHRGNILLQSVGDKEEELRAWSIDLGNAIVGWPHDFLDAEERVADPRNHAKGLPISRMEDAAMEAAHFAQTIPIERIGEYAQEACGLVRESTVEEYTNVLYLRCSNAVQLVSRYIARLKSGS